MTLLSQVCQLYRVEVPVLDITSSDIHQTVGAMSVVINSKVSLPFTGSPAIVGQKLLVFICRPVGRQVP